MPDNPYLQWPVFRRSVVAAFQRSLTFAAALNAILTKVFFGFPPIDAVAFAASATLFLLVGMTACFVPVRRATRIDPLVVLRYE
jgi:ABC-type antimicrobial peptide transport system permease subunit